MTLQTYRFEGIWDPTESHMILEHLTMHTPYETESSFYNTWTFSKLSDGKYKVMREHGEYEIVRSIQDILEFIDQHYR